MIALVVLLLPPSARADETARLVLSVGNDRPLRRGDPTLRYADDDAVRTYELFEGKADTRILLTRIDDESRLYREVYSDIEAPTLAAVERAARRLRSRAAALRAEGRFVEIVFVFAGHGGLVDGRPYLALEDGKVWPADLERLLLRGDPADLVHVVLDACSAAGFVEGRGRRRAERTALPDDVLPFGTLAARYPRAGFVVASSPDGAAWEWSRFGSGVASHLVRSALSGAADTGPPDGRVTYDELGRFLSSSMRRVLTEDYRQEIRVVAPRALPSAAILDLRAVAERSELVIDHPGRYYLRDADGHRIVDLHQGRGRVRISLPRYSPRFALHAVERRGRGCNGPGRLRHDDCASEDVAYEFARPQGEVLLSSLESHEESTVSRGIIEDTVFEELLEEPMHVGVESSVSGDEVADDEPAPRPTLVGVGYRLGAGTLMDELGLLHGIAFSLDVPVGTRLLFGPFLGFGRATADPPGAPAYPVYEVDLGARGGVVVLRAPVETAVGLELSAELLEEGTRDSSAARALVPSGGVFAQARVRLTGRVSLGALLGGGARAARVDSETRVRPWGSASVSAWFDL